MAAGTRLRIAVGATFNVPTVGPSLTRMLSSRGIEVTARVIPAMQVLAQMDGPAPELAEFSPDIVTVFLHCDALLPTGWSPTDLAAVEETALSKVALIADHVSRFVETSGATVVVNTVPLSESDWRSVVSWKHRAAFGRVWRNVNGAILDLATASAQVHVLDLEVLAANIPARVTDERLLFAVDAAWSAATEQAVAAELASFAMAFTARSKRVVAVDFDGTLWGGIAAEDGSDALQIGGRYYPGNCFASFQSGLKRLEEQGILLLGTSKNDWETVRPVFESHPDVRLRETDFAALAVGWDPKSLMVQEVLETLSLPVETCVFVDDTAEERAEIGDSLPGIEVVDPTPPERALTRLLRSAVFDVLDLTEADRRRTQNYHGRRMRHMSQAQAASRDAFLHGLGTTVRISRLSQPALSRFVQLNERTNQFNTSPARYSSQDLARPGRLAFAFAVSDRFADEGMVGGVVMSPLPCSLALDSLFMSCRVMGRGIERAVLAWLGREAAATAMAAVHVGFVDTPRNGPARRALEEAGAVPEECACCGPVLAIGTEAPVDSPVWLSVEAFPLSTLIGSAAEGHS